MRDPGDEDDTEDSKQRCPFCHLRMQYSNYWRTPLLIWRPFPIFEARVPDPMERAYETLDTCASEACREQARRFAEQHNMSPSKKQLRVYRRWRPSCF